MQKVIILASASPRRQILLSKLKIPFRVVVSAVSERTCLKRPSAIVKSLAIRKAETVAAQFPDSPVLGADTIVVCKGKIIGKPAHTEHALKLLKRQNGNWQSVYTGVAVILKSKNRTYSGYAVSRCKARRLPDEELVKLSKKHLDKAGAYAVQDASDPFIEKIVGRWDNVVGLPCDMVVNLLKKTGWRNS